MGKKLSKEHKIKISESLKGKKYKFSKRKHMSKETKEKISLSNNNYGPRSTTRKGMKNSLLLREKISRALTGRKLSKEHIKNCLKRNIKSTLEIKFGDLIKELNMPYKFVGNGEILIARKCPDFINIKGEKIAVEVYYRRHKELFRGGLNVWKAERFKIFSDSGWKLIFFDETEVNKEIIKQKLGVN